MSDAPFEIGTERARMALEAILGDEKALAVIGKAMQDLSNDQDGELLFATVKPLAGVAKVLHAADVGLLDDLEEKLACRLRAVDVERSSTPEALNHPDGPVLFFQRGHSLPAPEHVVLEVDLW